ncbi:MAG TPA: hypothetical protein PKE15_11005 [Ottowia sp.]|nr:hypothetical protein [Ottowia sp.]
MSRRKANEDWPGVLARRAGLLLGAQAGLDVFDLGGVGEAAAARLVAGEEPHQGQRNQAQQHQHEKAGAPARARHHGGDQGDGDHRPDRDAQQPGRVGARALAGRKPVFHEGALHRPVQALAQAQQHAGGQQHAETAGQAAQRHRHGPQQDGQGHGLARPQPVADGREHDVADAVGKQEKRHQHAHLHRLAGNAHAVQEGWIGHQHRDVDAIEVRDQQGDEKDDGQPHAGARGSGGGGRGGRDG